MNRSAWQIEAPAIGGFGPQEARASARRRLLAPTDVPPAPSPARCPAVPRRARRPPRPPPRSAHSRPPATPRGPNPGRPARSPPFPGPPFAALAPRPHPPHGLGVPRLDGRLDLARVAAHLEQPARADVVAPLHVGGGGGEELGQGAHLRRLGDECATQVHDLRAEGGRSEEHTSELQSH